MLVNGVWKGNWQPVQAKDEQGRFLRQTSSFATGLRRMVPRAPLVWGGRAEKGRYQLYVAYICP